MIKKGIPSTAEFTYLGESQLSPVTTLAKEVKSLVVLVCLSVYEQHYSKHCKRIAMKFYGGVRGGKRNN